jgi:DNA-binding transcriptional MerR regulator
MPPNKPHRDWLSTSAAAQAVGIHPNTLRWYEASGRLPPVPRTPSGYRMYSPDLVALARIVSLCHKIVWVEGPIRRQTLVLTGLCRDGRNEEARTCCRELILFLDEEERYAREALAVIARWGRDGLGGGQQPVRLLNLSAAARFAGLTTEQIRNWERNALLLVPRNPCNGYRLFGAEDLDRLRVIRVCRRAGYSLTAIRRLLMAVDASPPGKPVNLAAVAENPLPEEKAFFNTFPSDTLLTTLAKATAAAETILGLIPNPPI